MLTALLFRAPLGQIDFGSQVTSAGQADYRVLSGQYLVALKLLLALPKVNTRVRS